MHWFPLYPSDFIGATVGLSCQEVSVYSWMLTLYYELGPFPIERVRTYRIVRCESDEQKRTVDYILGRFFVMRDDGWYQERAEQERVKQARLHEVAIERGKRSADVRLTKYGTSQPGRVADPEKAFESVSKASGKEPELTTTTSTTTKRKEQTLLATPSALPDWFPADRMEAFRKHRKAIKKPISEEGERLLLLKLDALRREGHDPIELVNDAIANGWQGIVVPKTKPHRSPADVAAEAMRMMEDR